MICCKINPPGIVANDQALRFRLVHEIGVDDVSGARHIFNSDRRIAGNVLAQVTPDRA